MGQGVGNFREGTCDRKRPLRTEICVRAFFLRGHLKCLIYETPEETEGDLMAGVLAPCKTVRTRQGSFGKVRRCNACSKVGGHHFEQLLRMD